MGVHWIRAFAAPSNTVVPISLVDDFADGAKAAAWAAAAAPPTTLGIGGFALGGSVSEALGVLTINGFSASAAQYNGYSSASTVNMAAGQSIWVKASATGNVSAMLALQTGPSFYCVVSVDRLNGLISASNNNSGSGTTFWGSGGSVPYDSSAHAWVRLTNTGTQFEVHTAPDNSGSPGLWTLRGTTTSGYAAPSAVTVGVWAAVNNATPGSVVFDGFCANA
jgi:hypothetical protein